MYDEFVSLVFAAWCQVANERANERQDYGNTFENIEKDVNERDFDHYFLVFFRKPRNRRYLNIGEF